MLLTRRMVACWLVCAAAVIATEGQTSGQFGRGPAREGIRGPIKAIDVAKSTITLSLYGENRQLVEKTFTLAKDVEVALSDGNSRFGVFKEGKLADLVPETMVNLSLSADQKVVESIAAEGPTIRARIKSVLPSQNKVTVVLSPRGAGRGEQPVEEEKTYSVVANAHVVLDDGMGRARSIKLADLSAGVNVNLRLSVDQKQVQSVHAEGPSLFGVIKATDAAKKTVTLKLPPGRGGEGEEEKTVEVAGDTLIVVDDGRGRRLSVKEVKLAEVPVGSQAMVRLTMDQKAASMLRAEGPSLSGLIKAVDATKGTITIAVGGSREQNPEEKTFPVAKDARIVLDANQQAKLADIKISDEGPFGVVKLTLDQKTAQAIMVQKPR